MTAAEERQGQPRRAVYPALLLHLFIVVVLTYPLLLDPSGDTPGLATADKHMHLWDFWWAAKSLAVGQSIYFSDYMYFPGGVWMWGSNCGPLLSLFAMLAGQLGALNMTYNLVVFFSLIMTGVGGIALGRHLFRSRQAAFVVGAVAAFNPYILMHIQVGLVEYVNLGFALLFVRYLLGMVRHRDLASTLLALFWLVMAATWAWYVGYFLVIFAVAYLIFQLPSRETARSRRVLAGLALWIAAIATFLILAHVATGGGSAERRMTATQEGTINKVQAGAGRVFALDALMDPSLPAASRAPIDKILEVKLINSLDPAYLFRPTELLEGQPFFILRWAVPLLLSIAGILFVIGRRDALFYGAVMVAAGLMALGPCFILGGQVYLDSYGATPYSLLAGIVPGINRLQFPHRFLILAIIALSILTGAGVQALSERLIKRRAVATALVGAMALLFIASSVQLVGYPMVRESVSVPQVYQQLAAEGGDFAILEVPLKRGTEGAGQDLGPSGDLSYFQTVHQKRRYSGDIPEYLAPRSRPERLVKNVLLKEVARLTSGQDAGMAGRGAAALTAGARALGEQGFRYILVHDSRLSAPASRAINTTLARIIGPPRIDRSTDDIINLYQLAAGGGADEPTGGRGR